MIYFKRRKSNNIDDWILKVKIYELEHFLGQSLGEAFLEWFNLKAAYNTSISSTRGLFSAFANK